MMNRLILRLLGTARARSDLIHPTLFQAQFYRGWRYGSLEKHFPRRVVEPLLEDSPMDMRDIEVPPNVSLELEGNLLKVSSTLGTNRVNLAQMDSNGLGGIKFGEGKITICSRLPEFLDKAEEQLSMVVKGCAQGYLIYIRLKATGYKVRKEQKPVRQGSTGTRDVLIFRLQSHYDVVYECKNVKAFIVEPTLICLFGIDRGDVQMAAVEIRRLRPGNKLVGERIGIVPQHEIAQKLRIA